MRYPELLKKAAVTPHPDDPLTRLRGWDLPYRTPHAAEYYTAAQIRDLQALAQKYKLEGADGFAKLEPKKLRYQLNGIIDNKRAWQRAVATKVNPEFQVAAAIHDIEFGNADGQDAKALEANARMKRNLQILSAATSRNAFTGWWNSNVHANIYKKILDAKYKDNLMAAWENKQRKLQEQERKAQRIAERAQAQGQNKTAADTQMTPAEYSSYRQALDSRVPKSKGASAPLNLYQGAASVPAGNPSAQQIAANRRTTANNNAYAISAWDRANGLHSRKQTPAQAWMAQQFVDRGVDNANNFKNTGKLLAPATEANFKQHPYFQQLLPKQRKAFIDTYNSVGQTSPAVPGRPGTYNAGGQGYQAAPGYTDTSGLC